jgi:hypothetical protein
MFTVSFIVLIIEYGGVAIDETRSRIFLSSNSNSSNNLKPKFRIAFSLLVKELRGAA